MNKKLKAYKQAMRGKNILQKKEPIIEQMNNLSYISMNMYQGFIFGIGSGLGYLLLCLFIYVCVSYLFFYEQHPAYM